MNEERPREIYLPEDAGVHDESNIEWWYFFAFLRGEKGGRYAVIASFFRVGELDIGKGHYHIHSLIDLDRKKRIDFSGFDRKVKWNLLSMYLPVYLFLHPRDWDMWRLYKTLLKGDEPVPHRQVESARASSHPAKLIYGENQMIFKGEEEESFDVRLKGNDTEIVLESTPAKPMVLVGEDGKPDDLFYYSFTRNFVHGKIKTANGIEAVSGQGWFDHQWGRDHSLVKKGAGWQWFGLQLMDGRELLVNEMTPDRPESAMANLIDPDGTLHFTRNITFEKLNYWKSLKSNARYPVEWKISIPDFAIELHVAALFPNQEMPIIGPLKAIWEGVCTVRGTEDLEGGRSKSIGGFGFMELVGYA